MHCTDRRRIVCRVFYLLNIAIRTTFLLQITHITVFRWLWNIESKTYMRSVTKTNILEYSLRSMVENDPLITLGKARATMVAGMGVSVFQQLVCVVLKTLGYSRKK